MDNASNKGLYTLIAIVVFGIFISLSYWLFQDQMKNVLADVMFKTSIATSHQILVAEYIDKNLLIGGDKVVEGPVTGWGTGKEFLRYLDTAPIFDTFGAGIYTISFDLQVTSPGPIRVYMQNGSEAKYTFYKAVQGTTTWKRHSIVVDIVAVDPASPYYDPTYSYLAFYGIYGTGVSPSVKNVKIQMGTADGIPIYEESTSSLTY